MGSKTKIAPPATRAPKGGGGAGRGQPSQAVLRGALSIAALTPRTRKGMVARVSRPEGLARDAGNVNFSTC